MTTGRFTQGCRWLEKRRRDWGAILRELAAAGTPHKAVAGACSRNPAAVKAWASGQRLARPNKATGHPRALLSNFWTHPREAGRAGH